MKPSELKRIVNKEFDINTLRAYQGVIEDRIYFVEKAIDLGTRPQIKGFMSHMKNLKEALRQLKEEQPGLWANIRAKRARGEKPSHGNSNAHKDAVKAGKKINKIKESKYPKSQYKWDAEHPYSFTIYLPDGEKHHTDFYDLESARQMKKVLDADRETYVITKSPDGKYSDEVRSLEEGEGKSLQDLKMGEKFTFNGKEFTFIELYPELPNAARVILPDGRKTVVSFGGGKVNTGKKAGIGPDAFGQGKGHHID